MKKKLTLNKNNATIFERMNEIYLVWDIDAKEARDIIKKMYYGECDEQTSVQDTRLILHNLVRSELDAEDGITNSAKLWAKTLLDFLNNEPEYIAINLEEYAKAMNNYLYTHKGEITNDELLVAYEKYYNVFKDYEYIKDGSVDDIKKYLEKMNASFNVNLLKENYNTVLDIFKNVLIHNDNTDCTTVLNYFIKDIKEVNIDIYNQMLLLQEDYYKQIKVS